MRYIMKIKGNTHDLFFVTDGTKEDGAYVVFCPNCNNEITDNPIEYSDDRKTFHATFVRIKTHGKEYKVICCPDERKCYENRDRIIKE